MSSITTTVTSTGASASQTGSSAKAKFDPIAKLDALAIIMEKYKNWEDNLSYNLFNWSARVLDLSLSITDEKSYLVTVRKEVSTLINEILINPLNPSRLLERPCTDGYYAWEARYLDFYLEKVQGTELENTSPFTGELIARKTHSFAIDVFNWANTLPGIDSQQAGGGGLSDAEKGTIIIRIMIAQKAITAQKFAKQEEIIKKWASTLEATKNELNAKLKEEVSAANQRAEDSEKAINEKIRSLEEAQQNACKILRSNISDAFHRLSVNKSMLSNSQATVNAQQNEISQLRAMIGQLDEQVKDLTKKKKRRIAGIRF